MQMRRERAEGKDDCLMPGSQKVMDSVPNYRVSLVPHDHGRQADVLVAFLPQNSKFKLRLYRGNRDGIS